jgi:hypothetical protein
MSSISDTLQITRQALETALTANRTARISATGKKNPIPERQYHKRQLLTITDENESKEEGITTEETLPKHIDIRI